MPVRLLVRTPQTKDGVNLKYDKNKQVVYKSAIVELRARRNFESLNARLPEHLRHEFSEITVPDKVTSSSNDKLLARLNELQAQKEGNSLQDRIKELEAELAAKNASAGTTEGGGQEPSIRGTVTEIAAKMKELTTIEEVQKLAEGDERVGVQQAATKRIAELEAAK